MSANANKISYLGLKESEELLQRGQPVLVYHKIERRPWGAKWRSLYLSPRRFGRHMAELWRAGFVTEPLSARRPVGPTDARRFVLTFDDGCRSVFEHAAPVLEQLGFRAIQFLVAGQIGGTNAWDVAEGEVPVPLMNQDEVNRWLAAGHEIGSHTISHPRLTRVSRAQQEEEVRSSKLRLEDSFGVPVRHFCYPYGDFDERIAELVAEAGYETACTLMGGVNLDSTPAFALRRLEGRYPRRNLRTLWRLLGWRG